MIEIMMLDLLRSFSPAVCRLLSVPSLSIHQIEQYLCTVAQTDLSPITYYCFGTSRSYYFPISSSRFNWVNSRLRRSESSFEFTTEVAFSEAALRSSLCRMQWRPRISMKQEREMVVAIEDVDGKQRSAGRVYLLLPEPYP